ncbi:LysM peptidoglycan-binding domain-containing M23 family metallopeptidase [Myxacorys almedinensis]|uniref:Peptidoglycan DD-metalloendopeptidase family protein n=1 Tax=Myxacorys almedinensis A TaxID=2690445 RepID=A0A8J7Z142_9CYAN|nr:M23 family metallopeptidase [Myxacorys almedinensis]NDJ18372.1 peptidoglycan DD-metalloendopeptidase family protein [Myxacorys almedinensis A]
MTLRYFLLLGFLFTGVLVPPAQAAEPGCPTPALSRLGRHIVASGETLESIAQKYSLVPPTLMGFNPSVRNGKVTVGAELLIPPYNGVRVEVPAGQSWRDVATKYRVRPDVLYEVNGCQKAPRVVFIPGVNWSPDGANKPIAAASTALSGYPLAQKAGVLLGYGWYIPQGKGEPIFHGGLDLDAPVGTSVSAIAQGTVAFAGSQGAYGNMVVINHQKGYQTRYAQLETIGVEVGQTVTRGTSVGTVGQTGTPSSLKPHLHFEVRSNSNLGWVAEDPSSHLQK